MRRLFQECRIGRGNAALLSESLAFAVPDDLREKYIISVSGSLAVRLIHCPVAQ